jgi:hypothetical protein
MTLDEERMKVTINQLCKEITSAIGPILIGRDNVLCFHCLCLSLTSLGIVMKIKKEDQQNIFDHYLDCAYEAEKDFNRCEDCQKK